MDAANAPLYFPLAMSLDMTGERFEYLTSASADDGLFRFRWTLAAGKKGPPEHIHPDETETFHVESGVLEVWLRETKHVLRPGDRLAVPPNVPHRFNNPGPEPMVAVVSLDGTRSEDAHVPVAAYWARAGRFGFMGVLRLIVHDTQVGASRSTSGVADALQSALGAALRACGVRPFPRIAWRGAREVGTP